MGALRTARDVLRPMIDGPLEYRLRRSAGRLMPALDQTGPPHLFHACVWKTASQWVRLILSDPRLLRYGGHAPFIWAHLRDDPGEARAYRAAHRSLLLTGYGTPEMLLGQRDGPMRGVFVIRDPRALLASWITSTRYTHRPNPSVLAHRAVMSEMTDKGALSYAARAFVTEFAPVLDGWAQVGAETQVVRFEDLTGADGEDAWRRLLEHLGLALPDAVLARVLRTYRIEALAGTGSSKAEADKYALRGKRRADFENFPPDPAVAEPLQQWMHAYGYG